MPEFTQSTEASRAPGSSTAGNSATRRGTRRFTRRRVRVFSNTVAVGWTLATALPLLWMFMSAFKTPADFAINRWGWPKKFTGINLGSVWTGHLSGASSTLAIPLSSYVKNSVIVTGCSLVLTLAVATPAAYSLVRVKFPGRGLILVGFVLALAVPVQALIIPIWRLENNLNLTNTYPGLILPYVGTAMPFAVLLLAAYFRSFPIELEEAARVDGLSTIGILVRVVLPLSKGPLSAIGILLANGFWNDFLFALVLMPTQGMQTLPVGVVQFTQNSFTPPMTLIMAALSLLAAPILVLYILFQRQITSAEFQLFK